MSQPVKLRDLLNLTKADVERALGEQAKDDNAVAGAAGQLGEFAASVGADELNKVLDTDIYELLAHAWATVQSVREGATKSRSKPGEPIVVKLGTHDVTHTCQPVLTFHVADVALPELKLSIELVARFESVALSIVDAKIRALAPGEVSAIARLKYKGVKLKEQPTPPWKLPGEISLGAGIAIP
ncbi:MAG TPA: hypothetical protein PLW68_13960 [Casimicrobiaceae bacterium]|nr:hypothetical protein [Casimicrobiaceae bacterium]